MAPGVTLPDALPETLPEAVAPVPPGAVLVSVAVDEDEGLLDGVVGVAGAGLAGGVLTVVLELVVVPLVPGRSQPVMAAVARARTATAGMSVFMESPFDELRVEPKRNTRMRRASRASLCASCSTRFRVHIFFRARETVSPASGAACKPFNRISQRRAENGAVPGGGGAGK